MNEVKPNAVLEFLPAGETFPIHILARHLHCRKQHLFNLIDQGELRVVDIRSATASRSCLRISRASALEFLQKRNVTVVRAAKVV